MNLKDPVHIRKRLHPDHLKKALNRIKNAYLNGSINGVSSSITEFFECCRNQERDLREGTIYLIFQIHESFNQDSDSDFIISQILQCYGNFIKGENKNFAEDVYNGSVAIKVWKNSFIDVVRQDITKHFFALDQLFHIQNFESETQQKFAYFHIRRLLYNTTTFNNAIEWIVKLNVNLENLTDAKSFVSSEKIKSPINFIDATAVKLQNLFSDGDFDEFGTCIVQFYSNCENEQLRKAAMKIILLISKIQNSDPSVIISHILIGFENFIKKIDNDKIIQEIFSVKIPDDLWDRSLKVALCQNREKCYSAIDLLFKISSPENETKAELLLNHIRELLGNKTTFDEGIKKVQAFCIDIEKLKSVKYSQYPDNENPWLNEVINAYERIQKHDLEKVDHIFELFYSVRSDKNGYTFIKNGYKKNDLNVNIASCPIEFLRSVTMELIAKIHSTNNNSSKLIFKICKMFYISAKDRVKDINVTDKLWIDAWNICVKNEKKNLEAPFALDLLFHIKKPETNERKIIIKDFVRKMISENETLRTAVIWINTFQLKEIKEEQFGAIVAYSLFFEDGMKNTLNQFNSGEDIIQYLITLDSWLKHTESNGLLNFLGQNNKDVVVDTLLSPISSTVNFIKYNSRRFAIEKKLENLNFHAYDEVFVYETKKKFEYMDRKYFEVYAKEVLKGANEKRKRYFLKSVSNDKMYAYCWAKYLRIDDHDLPEELKKYIISGVNVSEFIENIDNLKSHCVDKDSIEDCHFWNKSYKLITVISPEALNNFINEYLIHSIIIGMDCESGRSFDAAVLQLATREWLCLIDIDQLCKKLSEDEWISFFKKLFSINITRIGFSFRSDYNFLWRRFPFLEEILKDEAGKVLCLQTLTNNLLEQKIIVKGFTEKMTKNIALAKLAKSLLYIDMDKSEQQSDWSRRPLTQFQKIYAVADALVVVLLNDAMFKILKREFSDSKAKKIMENGYISYDRNIILFTPKTSSRSFSFAAVVKFIFDNFSFVFGF